MQRYAREILANFDLLLEDSEFVDEVRMRCLVPPGTAPNIAWKNIPIEPVGINHGNLWEQLDLPLHLRGNFLFSPANTGPFRYANQAITFHGASTFAVPHSYSFWFRLKYKVIFTSLSRLARVIFTNSKFSQSELAHYLKQPPGNFKVTPLAGAHIDRIQPDVGILKKHDLRKGEYVFVVGNQSPHKNLATVRNAAKLLRSNIKVVFTGRQSQKVFNRKIISDLPLNILGLEYVTDEELKALYMNALGYISPSYHEGFGLPVLEAMQCGCPVLCARAAALPEIAGDAALFFDPMDAGAIARAVDQIHTDLRLRNDLIQRGHQRTKEFAWQTTARTTLTTLLSVITTQK